MKPPAKFPLQGRAFLPHFTFFIFYFSFFISLSQAARPYHPTLPDPLQEPWRWRSYPELKGQGLRCMAQDRDGAMWFGVTDGAVRYDGVKWTPYTPADGLPGAPVNCLYGARDGSVYAGTDRGIGRFRDGVWERAFPPEVGVPWYIYDIEETSDGSVWAASYAWGALRLDRQGATLYTTRETGAGLQVGDRVLFTGDEPEAAQSNLAGPAGTAVTLTVERTGRAEPFEVTVTRDSVSGDFRTFRVYDIYQDRRDRMWFGLWTRQIVRHDGDGWRRYGESDGLDVGGRPRIAQTPDGTLWTVSESSLSGINRFDSSADTGRGANPWTSFKLSEVCGGLDLNPSVPVARDGTLWVGGYAFLHALRNNAWKVYRASDLPITCWRRTTGRCGWPPRAWRRSGSTAARPAGPPAKG